MSDGPRAVDPAVVEGPRVAMEIFRPGLSEQRVLLLDGDRAEMVDLATGDIRPWENGPPVSVPTVSTPFDCRRFELVQVQVLRDRRPRSVESVLWSLDVGGAVIDVIETVDAELVIAAGDAAVSGPIGNSHAIVVSLHPVATDAGAIELRVVARNAETPTGIELISMPAGPVDAAVLTIGGPSATASGRFGRRRSIAVHIDVRPRRSTPAAVQRVGRRVRRAVESFSERT